jgi:hypothetical protein
MREADYVQFLRLCFRLVKVLGVEAEVIQKESFALDRRDTGRTWGHLRQDLKSGNMTVIDKRMTKTDVIRSHAFPPARPATPRQEDLRKLEGGWPNSRWNTRDIVSGVLKPEALAISDIFRSVSLIMRRACWALRSTSSW